MKKIIASFLVCAVLVGCNQAGPNAPVKIDDQTDNRSLAANQLIAEQLKEDVTPGPGPGPAPKVPRSQCPKPPEGCGGTGRVKSGDGIIWMDCDNCVDDGKAVRMEAVYGDNWMKEAQLAGADALLLESVHANHAHEAPPEQNVSTQEPPQDEPPAQQEEPSYNAVHLKKTEEIALTSLPPTVSNIYYTKDGNWYFYLAEIDPLPKSVRDQIKLRVIEGMEGNYGAASAGLPESVVCVCYNVQRKRARIVAVGPGIELIRALDKMKEKERYKYGS